MRAQRRIVEAVLREAEPVEKKPGKPGAAKKPGESEKPGGPIAQFKNLVRDVTQATTAAADPYRVAGSMVTLPFARELPGIKGRS